MKLNEPERLKLEGRTCWRWIKHAKLHPDLFQAQQRECLNALDSQPRTFISASTVLQTERERQRYIEREKKREREKKKKKKQLIFISVFFCEGTYTRKTSWQISFPSIDFLAIHSGNNRACSDISCSLTILVCPDPIWAPYDLGPRKNTHGTNLQADGTLLHLLTVTNKPEKKAKLN